MLYRQFVELLVRIAYIKYGQLGELNKSLERLFQKVFPVVECSIKRDNKDSASSSVDGMSTVSYNLKREIPQFARTAN